MIGHYTDWIINNRWLLIIFFLLNSMNKETYRKIKFSIILLQITSMVHLFSVFSRILNSAVYHMDIVVCSSLRSSKLSHKQKLIILEI